jgi:hypothetical protein
MHTTLTFSKTVVAAVLALAILTSTGCSQYGEVSPKAYEVSTALYSACNQKDQSRLDKVEELISNAAESGELSSAEQTWLNEIVKSGRSGAWEDAAQDARTMMKEQIR